MTGLPRTFRLAMIVTGILLVWAPVKIVWEQRIAREQDLLRYHGVAMTRHLRDELGQGLTIGVLSGMRSVVADLVWLDVTNAWMNQEWFKMGGYINLCTALQPRSVTFWDIGGWQLAWNASVAAAEDPTQPYELRRLKASRFWIDKGLDIYTRGIENNPESWRLWADTGLLYYQRLALEELRRGQPQAAAEHFHDAAHYYEQAVLRPNCPTYLERFAAYMYDDAKDDRAAYQAWRSLWEKLTPEQRLMKIHFPDRIESRIRALEQKLSIPKEKRVFPN